MARVSIIMRTRDRAVLLRRALASVAAQTFTDYELILVNDGGNPSQVDAVLAESTIPSDRVRLIHNQASHGREAAVEDGLRSSQAEFFAIHDDDDTWEPGFLQACVSNLDAHPDYGAVATRCDIIYEHIDDGSILEDSRDLLAGDRLAWSQVDTMVSNFVPPISQVIRRSAADTVGHWDGGLETQADWDFNLRLMATYPVGFLPDEVLAHWHHRPAQGNALGNSVVDAAAQHVADNLAIRDRYVRAATDGEKGVMLVNAEYFRRLEEHAVAQHQALDQALESLSSLHQGMGHLLSLAGSQQREMNQLHARLQQVLNHLDHTLDARARRLAHRAVGPFRQR